MSILPHIYKYDQPFFLERGGVLPELEIAYHTLGRLNADQSNVVWVFHALTANSEASEWWEGMFSPSAYLNPKDYFIVCANILGSPYGSTSPLSIHPNTGKPYYASFPRLTIRDMVEAHKLLQAHLGIRKIAIGLGASMGGFQTYEWAAQAPNTFGHLILIATAPREAPWRVAVHAAQRMAIETDPTWKDPTETAGRQGVAAARAMGMFSYRSYDVFEESQSDEQDKLDEFKAEAYIRYQGEKLTKRRFNGFVLWNLSKALDSHNIGRGRGGTVHTLKTISTPVLQIGITSDLLFPTQEQREIAAHLPDVSYAEIASIYGHDGFLTETEKLNRLVASFFTP